MPSVFESTHPVLAADSPAFSLWLPAGLMTAGVVLLGVLVFLALRDRAAANRIQPWTSPIEDELDRLKRAGDRAALLTAAAERAADALDERAAELERLIATADERFALGSTSAEMGSQERHGTPLVEVESKRPPQVLYADPLARAVYELADAGRSPVQIAGELNEHTGKIELILNLRKSQASDRP
jgi:hypothetical protein